MSTTTSNLGLFKYDVLADAQQPYDINKCLNNNWDILDREINKKLSKLTPTGSSIQPVYINSSGNVTACDANIGNTVLPIYIKSGKFTVCNSPMATMETNLVTNGYIKFNNELMILWFTYSIPESLQEKTSIEIPMPLTFNNIFSVISTLEDENATIGYTGYSSTQLAATAKGAVIEKYTLSHITLRAAHRANGKVHFLVIGV